MRSRKRATLEHRDQVQAKLKRQHITLVCSTTFLTRFSIVLPETSSMAFILADFGETPETRPSLARAMTLWRLAGIDDVLTWVQANRALVPLTCVDLLNAQVITSADLCPID